MQKKYTHFRFTKGLFSSCFYHFFLYRTKIWLLSDPRILQTPFCGLEKLNFTLLSFFKHAKVVKHLGILWQPNKLALYKTLQYFYANIWRTDFRLSFCGYWQTSLLDGSTLNWHLQFWISQKNWQALATSLIQSWHFSRNKFQEKSCCSSLA